MARAAFLKLISLMGYGTAKQYAGRRAFAMYSNLCVPRPDEEGAFWKDGACILAMFGRFFVPRCKRIMVVALRWTRPPRIRGGLRLCSPKPFERMFIFVLSR